MKKKYSGNPYVMSPAKQREMAQKEKLELERINNLSPTQQLVELKKRELIQNERISKAQLQIQSEQLAIQKKQYESMMKCPKCGCTSISGNNKGYGVVKGGIGALAAGVAMGPVGAVIGLGTGNIGRKKVYCTCMSCGYRWKAGKK